MKTSRGSRHRQAYAIRAPARSRWQRDSVAQAVDRASVAVCSVAAGRRGSLKRQIVEGTDRAPAVHPARPTPATRLARHGRKQKQSREFNGNENGGAIVIQKPPQRGQIRHAAKLNRSRDATRHRELFRRTKLFEQRVRVAQQFSGRTRRGLCSCSHSSLHFTLGKS